MNIVFAVVRRINFRKQRGALVLRSPQDEVKWKDGRITPEADKLEDTTANRQKNGIRADGSMSKSISGSQPATCWDLRYASRGHNSDTYLTAKDIVSRIKEEEAFLAPAPHIKRKRTPQPQKTGWGAKHF